MYYSSGGYVGLVHKLAEDNMDRAVSEVKALSEYNVMGKVVVLYFLRTNCQSCCCLFVCLKKSN